MNKLKLYLLATILSCASFAGCTHDNEETVMYVGTISYAGINDATNHLVCTPIIQFFQDKLKDTAELKTTHSSFIISTTSDKQKAITKIFKSSEVELMEMIRDSLSLYVNSCDVMVAKGTEVILNVQFIGTLGSNSGHDVTEGTVPGFKWQ